MTFGTERMVRFVVSAVSQLSARRCLVEFEYVKCPEGFALSPSQGLDWISPPPDLTKAVGCPTLTAGEYFAEERAVEFEQQCHGRKFRVLTELYPVLSEAVDWWLGYEQAATIARDKFWSVEIENAISSDSHDFGEQFL